MRGEIPRWNGDPAAPTLQSANVVVATNGSGQASVTFPVPFVVAPVVVLTGGNGESMTIVSTSATGFVFQAFIQAGASINNGPVRALYIAMAVASV